MAKKFFIIYIKKKDRVKKEYKNEFSQLTGIPAIYAVNSIGCLLSKQVSMRNKYPIQKYAYNLYKLPQYTLNPRVRVKSLCKTANCVNKEHLEAQFYPNEEELKYLNVYFQMDSLEQGEHNLKVPRELLTPYKK